MENTFQLKTVVVQSNQEQLQNEINQHLNDERMNKLIHNYYQQIHPTPNNFSIFKKFINKIK
jgi:hypothetical protein